MTAYTTVTSPVGELLLVGDGSALTSLSMHSTPPTIRPGWHREPFTDVVRQLEAYFAGELTEFKVRFATQGTEFQERAWHALDRIPYGVTTTYGTLARELGLPRDRVQALGAALGANPFLLVRPCHRVIGADGSMRGYAAGVERKIQLLTHEGALQPALL